MILKEPQAKTVKHISSKSWISLKFILSEHYPQSTSAIKPIALLWIVDKFLNDLPTIFPGGKMEKSTRQTSVNKNVRYSEAFKRKVVAEINQGFYSVLGAMRKYRIGGKMTVYKWLAKYNPDDEVVRGANKKNKKNKSATTDLHVRIRNLEMLVSDLSIENKMLEATIKVAEEVYDTDLKKNFANASLTEREKKKGKS